MQTNGWTDIAQETGICCNLPITYTVLQDTEKTSQTLKRPTLKHVKFFKKI